MNRARLFRATLILGGIALLSVAVAIGLGATSVSWRAVLEGDATARAIVFRIRLPRVLLGALVGSSLAVAGLTFQTLLRNALADPFILGVSGGAACGAGVATAFWLTRLPGVVSLVAFCGACAATATVFFMARRRDHIDPARLLLSGLVLNAFFSAVILFSFALSPQGDLTAALRWMMGTLFGAGWTQVILVGSFLVLVLGVLLWYAGDLRMLAFGEDDARARGVDVEKIKLIGFASASLVTGAAVAVSGIIGFVGLLVPHLIRLIWRADFRFLLPLCAFAGAILLVLADLAARVTLTSVELPVGAFTALLGVPFFLSLMRRSK